MNLPLRQISIPDNQYSSGASNTLSLPAQLGGCRLDCPPPPWGLTQPGQRALRTWEGVLCPAPLGKGLELSPTAAAGTVVAGLGRVKILSVTLKLRPAVGHIHVPVTGK